MFIVRLDYQVPLTKIDRAFTAHTAYLERQYAAGRFLISGPLEPRTGGVIIAAVRDRRLVQKGWFPENVWNSVESHESRKDLKYISSSQRITLC